MTLMVFGVAYCVATSTPAQNNMSGINLKYDQTVLIYGLRHIWSTLQRTYNGPEPNYHWIRM